jgi:hypothetical protein
LEKKERNHIARVEKLYQTFTGLNRFIPKRAYYTMNYPKNGFISTEWLDQLMENTGKFQPWDYEDQDLHIELHNFSSLLRGKGFHFYVIDHTILNLPTIRVIVPELDFGYTFPEANELIEFKKKLLCHFEAINKEDLEILKKPRTIISVAQKPLLNMFFSIEIPCLGSISSWYFLGKLAKSFNLTSLAKKYLAQAPMNQLLLCLNSNSNVIKTHLKKLLPPCCKVECEICRNNYNCRYYLTKPIQEKVFKANSKLLSLQKKFSF